MGKSAKNAVTPKNLIAQSTTSKTRLRNTRYSHREGSHINRVDGVLAQIRHSRTHRCISAVFGTLQLLTSTGNILCVASSHFDGQYLCLQTGQIRRVTPSHPFARSLCRKLPSRCGQCCFWTRAHTRCPHYAIGPCRCTGFDRQQQKQQCADCATPAPQSRAPGAGIGSQKSDPSFPRCRPRVAVRRNASKGLGISMASDAPL